MANRCWLRPVTKLSRSDAFPGNRLYETDALLAEHLSQVDAFPAKRKAYLTHPEAVVVVVLEQIEMHL